MSNCTAGNVVYTSTKAIAQPMETTKNIDGDTVVDTILLHKAKELIPGSAMHKAS